MQEDPTQIIYEGPVVQRPVVPVDPMALVPGVVPIRLIGRKPKCFFSLLKSFIGTALMGFPAEPELVSLLLNSNPSFTRALSDEGAGTIVKSEYRKNKIPSC
jgi:hypothetical protein